jgi:hypothetical protein
MIRRTDKIVKKEIRELALAVVRGERPLDALEELGIDIDPQDDLFKLKSGNLDVTVTPAASDVALGILQYRSRTKKDLRKWAFFLLAESGAIDLSEIESHPQGEILLSALWDASFDGRVSSETIELAQHLTQ